MEVCCRISTTKVGSLVEQNSTAKTDSLVLQNSATKTNSLLTHDSTEITGTHRLILTQESLMKIKSLLI